MRHSDHARLPDVFSPAEVAGAAGVPVGRVRNLIARGEAVTLDGHFMSAAEARRVARALRAGTPLGAAVSTAPELLRERLFSKERAFERSPTMPAAVSTAIHLVVAATIVWIASTGIEQPEARVVDERLDESRLVFLNLPGPGGGGGGGGLRQPRPAPKAQRAGVDRLSSPLPKRESPPPPEPPKAVEPPPELEVEPLPAILAPVATKPADPVDEAGVIEETPAPPQSRGPGDQGGVGQGTGTGVGAGAGPGIGEGSGGGTGGGPYRPGAGIDPPRLLKEVKPNYTDEARRAGVRGDVLLEIVVRRDGSVGEVKLIEGLGHGLDSRAADAVRQWRFSPARRQGTPVDVIVEVAVEFNLR